MIIIGKRNTETFEIPNGVKELGNNLFHNTKFKEIKISDSVKKIGYSFQYCSELTKIVIPRNMEKIDNRCFEYCPNLKEIIIQKPKNSIEGSPWGAPLGMRTVIWQE